MKPFDVGRVPTTMLFAIAGLAFLAAAVVFLLGRRFVHRSFLGAEALVEEEQAFLRRRVRQLVAAVAVVAFGAAAIATLSLVLSEAGIEVPEWTPRQVVSWLLSHGIRTLVIVTGAYITHRVAHLAIQRFHQRAEGGIEDAAAIERRRRAATLGSITSSLTTAVVFFIAALMVLRELSIDIVPLLTGAGIAGLAIGFGAQNLVRDVISGFFLILEDQVGVGDIARIQSVTGVVEQIGLRTLVLRDADGSVHVFPNGTIATLANLSRDYAYAVADVVVLHGEHLGRALDALKVIGSGVQEDPAFAPWLLGPLEVLGVQELRETNLTVRVRIKTLPLKQFQVAAELRGRIAVGFAARGIKPFRM